ncbi:MAG: ABC transporter substrate-binding protein [Bacteroidota bacterium]
MKFLRKDNEAVLHVKHRNFFFCFFFFFIVFFFSHCSKQKTEIIKTTPVKYAKGFSVRNDDNATWVTVTYPYQGATSGYTYLLVHKNEPIPDHAADVQVVEVPVETIVCTSTTHIPHLDYLGVTDKLVGFPSTDYISSETARKRIDAGLVKDLGIDKGMNLELLYTLKPSIVMGYTMTADLGQLKKVQEMGIPVVLNGEYLERDPLGRAEWIKFTSLFFGKEKAADSIFAMIEKEYNTTRDLVANAQQKPSVLCGTVYGDAWFMPGGENYAAKLLKDASNNYLWASDTTHGWLEISFEAVYSKAKDADLWIVGSFDTFEQLKAADQRYSLFKPFETKQIYNYNARKGAKGGNDFLELGYMRPDLILKDLVKIGHPELLPDHQLYFHSKLN